MGLDPLNTWRVEWPKGRGEQGRFEQVPLGEYVIGIGEFAFCKGTQRRGSVNEEEQCTKTEICNKESPKGKSEKWIGSYEQRNPEVGWDII